MKRFQILIAAAAVTFAFTASAGDDHKKGGCCSKNAAAKSLKDGEGDHCAHAKAAAKTAHKGAAMCDSASKKEVAFTGKLVLGKDAPTFQADGREGALALCPETSDLAGLETAGKDGTALEVKGMLCKSKDGKEMLSVTSFKKAPTKTASS